MDDELSALRAELEALRGRAALWRTAEEMLHFGVWERDLVTGVGYWSDEVRRMFGMEAGGPLSQEQFLAAVHPEDRSQVVAAIRRVQDDPSGAAIVHRHRIIRSTGEVRWMDVCVRCEHDASGSPRRLVGITIDRTDAVIRQLAEKALRESEQTLHELGEHVPALIWVRDLATGEILYANGGWTPFIGCEPERGSSYRRLLEVVHPDDRVILVAGSQRAIDVGFDEVVRFVDRQGTSIPFRLRAFSIRDATGRPYRVVGFAENISEQRAAEQALRESEARYRSVVLAMSDGIVVHGRTGEIVTANPAAERILGLTLDQLKGRTSLDPRWHAIREDGSPFPGEEHPGSVTLRTGQPQSGVIMGVQEPDGTRRWISVNSRRVAELGEDGAYSAVASFTDITERRAAEERVLASLREKEILLKEIHHRVKNNLQIVSSLLYLQSTKVNDPRYSALLKESQNRVASMGLIHEMLYQSPDLSRIPFASYVRRLVEWLGRSYGVGAERVTLELRAGDLVLDIDTAVPCGLLLNEIVSNSLKHAYSSGRNGVIRVTLELGHDDRYRLCVSDDGPGLPPDLEERERSSLGMKLIDRLIEQLGGERVRSSSPGGTRYEISFPRDALPTAEAIGT